MVSFPRHGAGSDWIRDMAFCFWPPVAPDILLPTDLPVTPAVHTHVYTDNANEFEPMAQTEWLERGVFRD